MDALFQHVVYAPRIDTVNRTDVMLIFATPMAQPNINSIIESEAVRFRLRDSVFIEHRSILIFESASGDVDSAVPVQESVQVLADSAATSPNALRFNGKPVPQEPAFPLWRE